MGDQRWETPAEDDALPAEAVLDALNALADRITTVETAQGDLADAVSAVVEGQRPAGEQARQPRRYRFDALDAEGKRELWLELADFVDYLNAIFGTSAYTSHQRWRIPDWWWKQPIVVFELAALKASFDEAFTSESPQEPTTEMIAWLDRWFWPCMSRIFNKEWGLLTAPAPGRAGAKFAVLDATNDREEFMAFLDSDADEERGQ